jgi:hypothetical protein
MKVKNEFVWPRGCSCLPREHAQVIIPSGAPVKETYPGDFFVNPSFFKEDAIVRHDATYHGCRVKPENVEI